MTTQFSATDAYGLIDDAQPLHILVLGAGIGGLSAAKALRDQGHKVEIFEQSKLSQETGAAIHLGPNANGLVRRLGLDVEKIGGVECMGIREMIPETGQLKYEHDLSKVSKMWQHPWQLVHRAHLHTALRELATGLPGFGTPAKLHLGSRVKAVDAANASIELENGTKIQGDLLIGADGVHSRTRVAIPGGDLHPFDSGKSAFRFLLPHDLLAADPKTSEWVSRPGWLTMWIANDRRLVMYPCMGHTMWNFVAIHPSSESPSDAKGDAGWQQTGSKNQLLQIYRDMPSVLPILEKVDESQLKVWKLLDMEKMPSFIEGRLALIGDAAHPFLPHQGQGGGQAIEDAISLAALLPRGVTVEDLPERLSLYQQQRYERSHQIQDFTRQAGKDATELAAEGQKLDMQKYSAYNFGHDEWHASTAALQKHLASKQDQQDVRYRAPTVFGPSPGPRQPLNLHPSHPTIRALRQAKPETSTTYSIRFHSSRTYLQHLLPKDLSFAGPGTAASASISCTSLDNMTWLGGGGYNYFGLYIHGVTYTGKDGKKIHGTFMPILFENLTDPIVTGRSELGMPKLFADIDVRNNGSSCNIAVGWRGAVFGRFELGGISEAKQEGDTHGTNGETAGGSEGIPAPPPPPPEEGLFVHRYVPAVGEPGKVDADYIVFKPNQTDVSKSAQGGVVAEEKEWKAATANVGFEARDWVDLPTLHNVAKALSEVPVFGIEEAGVKRVVGHVEDLRDARRLD